ncbi:MAG: hypothetical protein ABWY55_07290 [Microbacterium sp.]
MLIVGLILVGIGLACYFGVWRSWASTGRGWFAPGFGCLYIGLATVFASLLIVGVDSWPRAGLIAGVVVMTALFALGILSFFWLPAFLTPRWFRESRTSRPWSWGGRS